MDLSGRRAVVTGGAGHVGGAVCEALMELGARVALLDKDGAACRKRAAALASAGGTPLAVPCDLNDERATRRAIDRALGRLGGLEILVHCATYTGPTAKAGRRPALRTQLPAAMESTLRVDLTAALVITQQAGAALGESGRGSMIFFSSIYGLVGPDMSLYRGTPMYNDAGYNAAKGGVLQLTRYLATTLAPRTRVNAVSPGGIWRNQPAAFHRRYRARTPLGRMATEEDLKGAVAFLASDLSRYVTGHNLVVDGGWTAW